MSPRLRRPRLTVRTRVLAAVVSLAALGMAVAGTSAYLIQRQYVDRTIDEQLARHLEEFRILAQDGVDPATGADFTTVRDLIYTAMQRTAPAAEEGVLGVVDGRVALVAPSSTDLRIEDEPGLVELALAAEDDDTVRVRTLYTADRSYRHVTIPVSVPGDPDGGAVQYAVDREARHHELVRSYRTYSLVALAALVVLGVAGWIVAGRLLAPIRLLRDTARRITDSDLSERIPVSGNDDLSDLARTANSMLDRLETAFAAQRRLLDDAGHELRTPLTIVRGHLELLDPEDPLEVRSTQTLVIDELDRMHRLVDDLLLLATSTHPDFVRATPTDVGPLTDEVLDKARALGPQRWLVSDRAEVTTRLDAQRITQAWLQLAANAAKFSPDHGAIRLSSRVRGGRLLLGVQDEGPGVPDDEAERIFERFARGQATSRAEGSGLGLAIVGAIARAHDGEVRLEPSTSGAHFTIDLPLSVDGGPDGARPGTMADDPGATRPASAAQDPRGEP